MKPLTLTRIETAGALFYFTVSVFPCQAATLLVPSEYPTIQAGIDAAAYGDSVLVAPGTYSDYETRYPDGFAWTSCAFLRDGVTVKSEAGPGSTILNVAALVGPQPWGIHGFELPNGPTRFEGFALRGEGTFVPGAFLWLCEDLSLTDCEFIELQDFGGPGAGVVAVGDLTLVNCAFYNCKSFQGGGLYHTDGHLDLLGCLFQGCEGGAVESAFYSGGHPVTTTVIDCSFYDNVSNYGALVIGANEGATVRGCRFFRNSASLTSGGGLGIVNPVFTSYVATVENCVFVENGSAREGGGLAMHAYPGIVRGNTFYQNYNNGTDPGSSVALGHDMPFQNNIIAGSRGAPAVGWDLTPPESSCNVFWDNPLGIGYELSPTDRVVDPQFCDPLADDFTLRLGSPCLPPGSLGCGQIGAWGQGCGTISVESKSWGAIKSLYRKIGEE